MNDIVASISFLWEHVVRFVELLFEPILLFSKPFLSQFLEFTEYIVNYIIDKIEKIPLKNS